MRSLVPLWMSIAGTRLPAIEPLTTLPCLPAIPGEIRHPLGTRVEGRHNSARRVRG